ncbi:multimeric flavodoxin WrbA [Dyadobacter jejuensis]|uniref:Multimeric flavodoxin WrbA n=1 Tax=Dyadobacter jejuensis TaxID=1082580 RepID=A0A316AKQ4_9BACT|nr:NAD(P)H-dependent oxidoreductase [Dyadobacter jejuensis]PWJ58171.1 multimeric flavodoxin WrbA [Dyadobacter jejuensis]
MKMQLNTIQKKWNEENETDFSNLLAVFLNCTLKKSPDISNTEGLMTMSQRIMEANRINTKMIRVVDHQIAYGVQPDMTEHGWDVDEWPDIQKQVMEADILVIGSPIWLGEKSSVATLAIERLYANSGILNEKGQYAYYGKVGGCIITGNEDGIKHCSMNLLYSLQHLGYSIPPQADAGWIGEAGPGPSYLDEPGGGLKNDFTTRNTTFMTWNLMHLAKMLKQGYPAHGNQRSQWDQIRHDNPNPEYR